MPKGKGSDDIPVNRSGSDYDYRGSKPAGSKSNFRNGRGVGKSGAGVSPHASGSPWKYGRGDQQEADYSKDYSRRASSAGSGVVGPKMPSADVSIPLYKGNKDREGN